MPILFRFALLWIFALHGAAIGAEPGRTRPFALEDSLRLVATGAALVSDDVAVWEQAPEYRSRSEFGTPGIGAWSGGGYQIWSTRLRGQDRAARLLFSPAPDTSYWLDSFSPRARFLSFYLHRAGHVQVGVYDLAEQATRIFNVAPRIDPLDGFESVWISDHEFVFAAHAEGTEPSIAIRTATADRFRREWARAFDGTSPSVNVVESGPVNGTASEPLRGRLVLADAATGEMRVLAEGAFDNLTLSRDRRYLAGLLLFPHIRSALPGAESENLAVRGRLRVFDLVSGRTSSPLPDIVEAAPNSLEWSVIENRLALFGWPANADIRAGRFYSVSADNGDVTPLNHDGLQLVSERERGLIQRPERTVWIGSRLAVFARPTPGARGSFAFRDIDRHEPAGVPRPHWFLLSTDGPAEDISPSLTEVSSIPLYSDGASLVILADGAVYRTRPGEQERRLSPEGIGRLGLPDATVYSTRRSPFTRLAVLEAGAGLHRLLALDVETGESQAIDVGSISSSPSARVRALSGARSSTPTMIFRLDGDDGSALLINDSPPRWRQLQQFNLHMRPVQPIAVRPFSYAIRTETGPRNVTGCLMMPPGPQTGRRHPVVVEVYPGRQWSCTSSNSLPRSPTSYPLQLLAARGFVVFFPNEPSDLERTREGPLAGAGHVVLDGVDALIAAGVADPRRIGLLGFSQGGFAALWLTTRTDRFRAAVSLNGWADLYTHYFEGRLSQKFNADEYPYLGQAIRYETSAGEFALGANPWGAIDRYMSNSPLYNAERISTPLLMIHSDMDFFTLSQYEMLFTALYRLGRPAKFLRYWGEGHSPSSPANIRDMWANILAWYDRYLDIARSPEGDILWSSDGIAQSRQGQAPLEPGWFEAMDRRLVDTESELQNHRAIAPQ